MVEKTLPDERAPQLPIGALSQRTGSNIETIRYYEKIGLLPAPARTEGRHRMYSLAHLKRLNFVRRARGLGFTLDEVRALLRLADHDRHACAEAREIAAAHLADVRKKIADLRAMETVLADTVDRCHDGVEPSCPLIEALSADEPDQSA